MKTKIKGLLAILFALFIFSSVTTKAQQPCPKVANNTHCTFKVIYREYIKNPQTGACDVLCTTSSNIIPAGASIPFPCTCVRPVCKRSIEIVGINGVPIMPTVIIDSSAPNTQPLPPNQCGATGVKFDPSSPAFIFF
jgi:hypothetical protein